MDPETRSYENAVGSFSVSPVPVSQVRVAAQPHSHTVQFYEDEVVFLDGLSEFVGSALGTGGACVVIATLAHRKKIAERLKVWGINVPFVVRENRYICLDAAETLARITIDGWPDEKLFLSVIEPALIRARRGIRNPSASVVAFGEMVALLWADGKCEAALRLEQLWNDLAHRQSFSLQCAYPIGGFRDEAHDHLFLRICAEHSDVIPAESYTSLDNEDERLRMVSSLQQKAQMLRTVVEEREREIVQRQEVEEKLRRSEEFARKIVESSIDCFKVLDLEGRLEYMSPPGQRALEIDDIGPFLGRRWIDFWKEEDRPRAQAALAAARAGGIGSFQGERFTLKGSPKSWYVKITPALDSDGAVERLIVVSRDITDLKRAQMAVMQSEKLAVTGRLAATIAHEINNPLEAVTNFIYLAKTSPGVPEEVCQQLEIADRELARVAQIAQQTLGFYRDNSQHKWISVADLIHEVMTIYDRRLRYKHLEAIVSAAPEMKLFTRQGELRQALANLMANAIDASSEGGKLWLRAQPTKNWTNGMEEGVRITLADNGSGMTPDVQRQIFEPFFTTKADVGTGIGLWVTKSLIEKQGGYMRFRSRQGPNAGTVMSFFLPLNQSQHADASGSQ